MPDDYGNNTDTPSEYVMLTAFQRQRCLLLERVCVTFHVHWLFCSALKLMLITFCRCRKGST